MMLHFKARIFVVTLQSFMISDICDIVAVMLYSGIFVYIL